MSDNRGTPMITQQLAIRTAEILTCVFAPDGARARIGSQGNPVVLWDGATGECLRILDRRPVGVVAAAFSQDERRAFSCDWNGGIGVWDLQAS